tara:strand:+ start:5478 stop:7307 length:1830 start_codon:yes stop_codon:yes gene_type:complete
MELTIEKALELGIDAHNAGNFQKAESIYRAILETDPNQPIANYNLGCIAVVTKNSEAAIPLYRVAVQVQPDREDFWISYIAAFIAESQIKQAKKAFKDYKKKSSSTNYLIEIRNRIDVEIAQPTPAESELKKISNHYHDGSLTDAEDLAMAITQKFTNNKFSWRMLGAIYKESGRLNEALIASKKLVELDDKDEESHINLGSILQLFNKFDDAIVSYKKAILLNSENLRANFELGTLLLGIGRHLDAELSLNKVIVACPDYSEAHNNLGAVYIEQGRLDDAEKSYRRAILFKPEYSEALINLANTLQLLGKLYEAEECYKKGIALTRDNFEARFILGKLLFDRKKFSEAVEQFKSTDFGDSANYLLKCFYFQNEKDKFYDQLGIEFRKGKINAVIGSLTSRSEVRYGIRKVNPFCQNPLDYVLTIDLQGLCDFKNIFINKAKSVLSDKNVIYRGQGLLHNGQQTAGNLFLGKSDLINDIERVVRSEIEKYRAHFGHSQEGFITNWPTEYKISGWLVSMQDGGSLEPHIHDSGWITGGIYINVPIKSQSDGGNLVVSIGDETDFLSNENMMSIDVVTGSLCLFPASLTHYTIPFVSTEDRIVLAFDVIPV